MNYLLTVVVQAVCCLVLIGAVLILPALHHDIFGGDQ